MQLIQDVVVDNTLQSFISMHQFMNALYIKAVLRQGQFAFYLVDIVVKAVSCRGCIL